jgi:hypothetical protein
MTRTQTEQQKAAEQAKAKEKRDALQAARDEFARKMRELGVTDEVPSAADIRAAVQKVVSSKKKKRAEGSKRAPDTVKAFVQWFVQSPVEDLYDVKCGQWQCKIGDAEKGVAHALLFHSQGADGETRAKAANVICVRSATGNPVPIFNASAVTYGNSGDAQKNPQAWAEQYGAVPVPFETIKSGAKLNLYRAEVLEWAGAERLLIPPVSHYRYRGYGDMEFNIINRHFAGAVLLKVEDEYFLFDCDREELHYHNFNPFFTQLPRAVTTIAAAYDSLMPKAVREAQDAGVDVIRQGEFFFVKVPDDEVRKLVYQHMDTAKKPPAYAEVAYNHLVDRALVWGARNFNCDLAEMKWHAEKWLASYQKSLRTKGENGVDPESPNAISKPADAIAPYLAWLDTQVGPKEALLTDADLRGIRRQQSDRWYGNDGDYRMDPISQELSLRLNETSGMDRDTQLRFKLEHSASKDERSGRDNGHEVTLSFIHPTDKKQRYALGMVEHSGRQHRPIYLPGWYRIYTNTATNNWTVHGDVD